MPLVALVGFHAIIRCWLFLARYYQEQHHQCFIFKIHVMVVYQCFGLLLAGASPNYIDDALYSLLCCTVMFSDLSKVTERSLSEVLNIKLCNF